MKTYVIDVTSGAAASLDLSSDISSGHALKVTASAAGVHILLTPSTSSTDADANDYLLTTEETEFVVGRGLDRITVFKEGVGDAKVYIAALY